MNKKNQKIIDHLRDEYHSTFHTPLDDRLLRNIIQEQLEKKQVQFVRYQIDHLDLDCKELEKLTKTLNQMIEKNTRETPPQPTTKPLLQLAKKKNRINTNDCIDSKPTPMNFTLETNSLEAHDYLHLESIGQPMLIQDDKMINHAKKERKNKLRRANKK